MVGTARKEYHLRIEVDSDIVGNFDICIFNKTDRFDLYLQKPLHPMKYVFSVEPETSYHSAISEFMDHLMEYWED